jgi:type 1 glutamine amidotransferase
MDAVFNELFNRAGLRAHAPNGKRASVYFANKVSAWFLFCAIAACATQDTQKDARGVSKNAAFSVLVFSKTTGFRHSSIPNGIAMIQQLGVDNEFAVEATEDSSLFNDGDLANFRVVVFLSTTGTVLDSKQRSAFERYIQSGGGFVGIHSATDTEYEWAWYGRLVGTYFRSHPDIQPATVVIEDPKHPSTASLPALWMRTDEWYNFQSNPRGRVHVLAVMDESTYSGGDMGDHPISWCHDFDGGYAWYTALGHTEESYGEADFQQHVLGGILSAAGAKPAECSVSPMPSK